MLFTVIAGVGGVGTILLGLYSLVTYGALGVLGGLLLGSVGLVACLLAIVVIWPVYLSLIGTIDSTASYAGAEATGLSAAVDDPVEILKREYAAGNVSETEFERRLDALLEAEEHDSGSDGDRQRDAARELKRT